MALVDMHKSSMLKTKRWSQLRGVGSVYHVTSKVDKWLPIQVTSAPWEDAWYIFIHISNNMTSISERLLTLSPILSSSILARALSSISEKTEPSIHVSRNQWDGCLRRTASNMPLQILLWSFLEDIWVVECQRTVVSFELDYQPHDWEYDHLRWNQNDTSIVM
jgi:hypothetical protein